MTRRRLATGLIAILALVLGTLALDAVSPMAAALQLPDGLQNFLTVFLGIFIEAAPFLLFGSLASGLIAVFVSADDIAAVFPRGRLLATVAGALLGIVFPVCECGVVPVVRRLSQKGLPISAGVAFLLAAPVINPVVIASTYAAFGFSPIFWARIGFTLVVAVAVGMVIGTPTPLVRVLRPRTLGPVLGGAPTPAAPKSAGLGMRLQSALTIAADDFFDVGRYLVVGSLLASALQTFVPQAALVAVGRDGVTSVLALQILAYVLSVCSTVDAFLALSFVNTFTAGSIVAFLIFGPMVDIKSTLMFLGLFRGRVVAYLLALTFLMALRIGVVVNFTLAW
ncbi:MAG: permease [Chloroflexi bacterium]|nr:permease [Chloroflexota bacterium]